jgi:BON domain
VTRIRREPDETTTFDLLVVGAAAAFGALAGYVWGGQFGRMTAHRVKRALKRRRRRHGRLHPGDWTDDDARSLEARAVDALRSNPVLARRPVRIRCLGPGLVELAGLVESPAEVQRAGQLVRRLLDVRHVINRLLVPGVDTPVASVPGPSSPRAARG